MPVFADALGEKNEFEDEDRLRGLVKAPSTGLLSAPPGGAWLNGRFPTAPGTERKLTNTFDNRCCDSNIFAITIV
jgi:hypothetical protein